MEQAVQKTDSLERLLLASAFTCASYYGSIHRDAKPFNPLLGETYEYQDNHCWFLAEQVRLCFGYPGIVEDTFYIILLLTNHWFV